MKNEVRYIFYVVVAIVAAVIIGGFFVIGSPAERRAKRLDDQRLQDLQAIQNYVLSHWETYRQLPADLERLEKQYGITAQTKDPLTGEKYTYRILDDLGFELCANFTMPSQTEESVAMRYLPPYVTGDNWNNHGEGMQCFKTQIHKDVYEKTYNPRPPLPVPVD